VLSRRIDSSLPPADGSRPDPYCNHQYNKKQEAIHGKISLSQKSDLSIMTKGVLWLRLVAIDAAAALGMVFPPGHDDAPVLLTR